MASFASAPLRRGILLSSTRSSLSRTQLYRRSLTTKAISNDASKFTLAVPPSLKSVSLRNLPPSTTQLTALQTIVVEHLQKLKDHKDHAPTLSFKSNAAVILATPAFARWLTDESFMSALLSTFSRQDVRVLAAVVDDLHALGPDGGPLAGFSVLQGDEGMLLPSVDAPASPRSARSREAPRTASLRFSRPSEAPRGPLSLNMPLANTVFQNGRDSTLLSCMWASQPNGTYTLANTSEKTLQEIALPGAGPSLSVPLIPVTPPRKILGCLGNIVSQIEVDGTGVPASTELENEVQGVFDQRKAAGNLSRDGMPVDVWALVSTPKGTVTEEIEGVMDSLEEAEFEGPGEEVAVAQRNAAAVSKLIMSGFQLHRISKWPLSLFTPSPPLTLLLPYLTSLLHTHPPAYTQNILTPSQRAAAAAGTSAAGASP